MLALRCAKADALPLRQALNLLQSRVCMHVANNSSKLASSQAATVRSTFAREPRQSNFLTALQTLAQQASARGSSCRSRDECCFDASCKVSVRLLRSPTLSGAEKAFSVRLLYNCLRLCGARASRDLRAPAARGTRPLEIAIGLSNGVRRSLVGSLRE